MEELGTLTFTAQNKLNSSDIPMSGWFLPSTGQWILALNGMGYTWDGATFGNAKTS